MFYTILLSFLKKYWFHGLLGLAVVGIYLYYTITISRLENKVKDLQLTNKINEEMIDSYEKEVAFYENNQIILEELFSKLNEIDKKYEEKIIEDNKIIDEYINSKNDEQLTDEEKKEKKQELIDMFNDKFDRMQ